MKFLKKSSPFRFMLSIVRQEWRLAKFRSEWRLANTHNKTTVNHIFPIHKVCVGNGTYGELRVFSFGGEKEGLEIGHYCSIAGDVTFILGGEHRTNTVSTYPFTRHEFQMSDDPDKATKGKIIIEDDVWIGHGATVLSGVHIGQGAVIAAESIVAKDVPPYAIFIGNDIKKYRFSEEIIEELLKIDYGKFNGERLERFSQYCTNTITTENVKEIVKCLTT